MVLRVKCGDMRLTGGEVIRKMECGVSLGKVSIKARYLRGRIGSISKRAGEAFPVPENACCSCSEFQPCSCGPGSGNERVSQAYFWEGRGIPLNHRP